MKKIITTIKVLLLLVTSFVFSQGSYGQAPAVGEYRLYITNELQTAPTVYQFDVYLLNMSATAFKLGNFQFGIFLDPAIKNGGVLSGSILGGSSELSNSAQHPSVVLINPVSNYFNLSPMPIPATANAASTISAVSGGCALPGTRIATFVVTNTVAFAANSKSNSIFSATPASGRTNTVVSAINLTTNAVVTITAASSNLGLGGTATCYQNITLNAAATCAVTGTGTTTGVTCAGGTNGTATITLAGTGSGAPGTYTVDGGSPQAFATNPFTITGLSGGNHTIVATVTAGPCTSTPILVNVAEPAVFGATYTKTNLSSCSATNDGSITVTATGGSGVYNYAWTGVTGSGNPATTPYPNPGNVSAISGLNYGFYNVTITDANGCGSVTYTNIHVAQAFTVVVSHQASLSSSCGNTGSITLYGNAGVPPYVYSLDGVTYVSGNTFTGLAAGPYTGYIRDAAGCVGTKSITLGAAAAIVSQPFATAASSCAPDGKIQIFRTGGIPPYTYSLDNITYQASNLFINLAAGPYTAWVKDSKGCTGSAPVTVAQGTGVTVGISKANTSTCVNDGSIQVNASGGIAPYTYSIDGGGYQASNVFGGLAAGNYVISVKDSRGCLGSANVNIALNPIVVSATVVNATSCAANNGQITLFRTGGVGPYTYSLDGNTYQSSNVFTGLAAGTYQGFVKDSKTCVGVLNGIAVGPAGCPPPPVAGGPLTRTAAPVKAVKATMKVNAYPNPSVEEFTLVLEGFNTKAKASVTVTDLLGRRVYHTEGLAQSQYRFGRGFLTGMYNVQVVQGTETRTVKLVKE